MLEACGQLNFSEPDFGTFREPEWPDRSANKAKRKKKKKKKQVADYEPTNEDSSKPWKWQKRRVVRIIEGGEEKEETTATTTGHRRAAREMREPEPSSCGAVGAPVSRAPFGHHRNRLASGSAACFHSNCCDLFVEDKVAARESGGAKLVEKVEEVSEQEQKEEDSACYTCACVSSSASSSETKTTSSCFSSSPQVASSSSFAASERSLCVEIKKTHRPQARPPRGQRQPRELGAQFVSGAATRCAWQNFGSPKSKGFILLNVLILFPVLFLLDTKSCDNFKLASFVEAQGHHQIVKKQKIGEKPQPEVISTEDQTILLRCVIEDQQNSVQWAKDGVVIFHDNTEKVPGNQFANIYMTGSGNRTGDYSIEIRAARIEDSGYYECQLQPLVDDGNLDRAGANVTVRPRPPMPPSSTTSTTSSSTADSGGSFYSSAGTNLSGLSKQQQLELAASELASPVFGTPKGSTSQLQQRDISPNFTPLSGGQNSLSQQQSAAHPHPSAFIKPHASTQYTGVPGQSNPGQGLLALLTTWPYMLLILAALLMLANIYLIYSLVKRHRRNHSGAGSNNGKQKHGFIKQHDNSLESGSSGGGSGSSGSSSSSSAASGASAGTASSRVGTNELSQCELEPSIEVPEIQSVHTFPINRICAMAPVQQVWNGHEFVAIDSNGWMLEI